MGGGGGGLNFFFFNCGIVSGVQHNDLRFVYITK